MPIISKTLRYVLFGLSVTILVVAAPLLVIKVRSGSITKNVSIGAGLYLLAITFVLLGISFGFSVLESPPIDDNTTDTTVPCFYQESTRLLLEDISTITIPRSAIGNNGLVMVVPNDTIPGETHVFNRLSNSTSFQLSSVKFTVMDAVEFAINDKNVFIAVTTTFPMKVYRQGYMYDPSGTLTLLPSMVELQTPVFSIPITFQVDPYLQTLLIGEQLDDGSVLYVYDMDGVDLLQTLKFTQITYGRHLQVACVSKGAMVVQTQSTIDERIGTLVYVYTRDGSIFKLVQGDLVENTNLDILMNVLVGDLVLLQANVVKATGSIGNWKTFLRDNVNRPFDFSSTPITTFTTIPFDIGPITNFGSNLQVLGTGGVVCQGFDASNNKINTYTASFSTKLKKWYNAEMIYSVGTTLVLTAPFYNNLNGNVGSVGSGVVSIDDGNSSIPYIPQPVLARSALNIQPSPVTVHYLKCTNNIPKQ